MGKTGPKAECLSYIKDVWTDMSPLSLRKKMEEMAKNPPPPLDSIAPDEKSLVDKLCQGRHRVEAGLGSEKTVKLFKEAIDRNYAHIRFSETKGGTELGIKLDHGRSDFSSAYFESGTGTAHVEGELTLDYVKVGCVADIDLKTLDGEGHLVKIEARQGTEAAELHIPSNQSHSSISVYHFL